jgi:Flp pilus assembly protein TadG
MYGDKDIHAMIVKRKQAGKQIEKGQSLVEFAISLTFMLLLLAGIVDLGRAFFAYIAVNDAVQEGAVYGSIEPGDITAIQQRVVDNSLTDQITDVSQVTVTIIGDACGGSYIDGTTGEQLPNGIRVTADYTYSIITPFLGAALGTQDIAMTASVEDTILTPQCP